jgi:hypothetical protein
MARTGRVAMARGARSISTTGEAMPGSDATDVQVSYSV